MNDSAELLEAWHRAGSCSPRGSLNPYAHALVAHCQVGPYRTLDDAEEDRVILALYRVDRPHATIADLHQIPPLALSGYHQLLHDLAREGLGPLEMPTISAGGTR